MHRTAPVVCCSSSASIFSVRRPCSLCCFSDLSIGQMLAVFSYLWFMIGPVEQLLNLQYAFYAAGGALSRINELLARADEPQYTGSVDPFQGRDTVGIEVQGLSFGYGDELVLNQMNLSIAPPVKKSRDCRRQRRWEKARWCSCCSVCTRRWPAPSVSVVRLRKRSAWKPCAKNVAVVLQHPALFNDTVRANLTMGRERSDEACWQALEIAQLHNTVRELPNGLDSIVGRSGVRLSGGQRQRLAIARMVLAEPKVVILDEATSALDAATEYNLHQALARFLSNRTTLIIAHRLSAVKQADRVLVFDGGQVAEDGDHQQLIADGGLYAKLYGHLQQH